MYKIFFKKVKLFIFSPAKGWEDVTCEYGPEGDVQSKFVYPFIGFIGISAFLSLLIYAAQPDFQMALKATILDVSSVFLAFFLSSFLMNILAETFFHIPRNLIRMQKFVGYSSVMYFTIHVITNLIPEFPFFWAFLFQTIYIVWTGGEVYFEIAENKLMFFTLLASAVIVFVPMVMYLALKAVFSGV